MEKETETNERNKNWSYFKFNNILSTLRNQQWHRIICVQCSNALLFRLPISKRREWDYKWNRRKKNRITKTRTKNIHNLSWRASHFLQFNSCIMSMLVEKKRRTKKRCRHQLIPMKPCGNRSDLMMQQQQRLWWVPLTLAIINDTHTFTCRYF